MHSFWEIIASNALVATGLAFGIVLLSRVWKNPAAMHLLWVVVLLKLFTPPVFTVGWPIASDWRPAIAADSLVAGPSSFAQDASRPGAHQPKTNVDGASRQNRAAGSRHIDRRTSAWLAAISRRSPSLSHIVVGIWICGSACISLWYMFRIRRLARLLNNTEPPPEIITTTARQLCNSLGLSRIPSISMTPNALPPLVWSIGGRPRIVLPTELFIRLNGGAQTAILAHELAHVRRCDYLVRLLELTATTLFWWHPVVWWACAQLRELEEQCCDSRVLELVPQAARTYAAALVDTLEFLSVRPRIVVPLPTAVYSSGSLSRRIRMLTQPQANRLCARSYLMIAALVALPLAIAFAETPPPAGETARQSSASLTGLVTNEAGEPLADAQVRVAIPATDMRFVDSSSDHKLRETKTDAAGEYKFEFPEIREPTTLSVDVMKPGYRRMSGTLHSGGAPLETKVAPGTGIRTTSTLIPGIYFKGVVVDEQGQPITAVKTSANLSTKDWSYGVERTASSPDGSFEIFNYSAERGVRDGEVGQGVVNFFHPDYVENQIDDVYALADNERDKLRIVLPTGRQIAGTLLDVAGQPVSGVMVKVTSNQGGHRKATTTDAAGKFLFRGLVAGPTTLNSRALNLKQKVQLPIALDRDQQDLEVRLQPIPFPAQLPAIAVLGMQLTDITPELQSAYDLYNERGALILDPGKDSERLGIGKLAEGYDFWMVGQRRIGSVREFIEQILAEAALQPDDYSIRVVYNFSTLDMDGSNTQHLKLTKQDLEELRTTLARLATE